MIVLNIIVIIIIIIIIFIIIIYFINAQEAVKGTKVMHVFAA